MKPITAALVIAVYLVLLSAKIGAMDRNTKQGIANFTLLTSKVGGKYHWR